MSTRIEGVDAVMLYARDPEALAAWYAQHLGIRTTRNSRDGRYYGEVPNERPLVSEIAAVLQRLAREPVSEATRRRAAALARKLKGSSTEPGGVHFGIYPVGSNGGGDQPAVMVNFRVSALPGVLRRLRSAGVEILDVERESYGTFAHVRDVEGNLIELWAERTPRPRRRTSRRTPARN